MGRRGFGEEGYGRRGFGEEGMGEGGLEGEVLFSSYTVVVMVGSLENFYTPNDWTQVENKGLI